MDLFHEQAMTDDLDDHSVTDRILQIYQNDACYQNYWNYHEFTWLVPSGITFQETNYYGEFEINLWQTII